MQNNDLISRKALMDAVDKSLYNNPHSIPTQRAMHKHEHNHFLVMILQAPAVDAAPVVHGRYRKADFRDEWFTFPYDCLECGCHTMVCKPNYDESEVTFCGNCGAKMDRKDDT